MSYCLTSNQYYLLTRLDRETTLKKGTDGLGTVRTSLPWIYGERVFKVSTGT
jgi:hypothetical protein